MEEVKKEVQETEVPLQDDKAQEPTTQPASEADVEKDTTGTEPVLTWEQEKAKYENERKSWEGKMSKFEKENKDLKAAATLLRALDEAAGKDPEFKKATLRKLVDAGLADASLLEQDTPSVKTETSEVRPVSTPETEWAKQKMLEEQQKEAEFYMKFEEDKKDIAEGDPNKARQRRLAIANAAAINQDRGMTKKKAFELAYLQIMHPQKLKEEGVLEGILKAQNTATIGGGLGGTTKTKQAVQLSEAERNIAKSLGMSDEEYALWKDPTYTGK